MRAMTRDYRQRRRGDDAHDTGACHPKKRACDRRGSHLSASAAGFSLRWTIQRSAAVVSAATDLRSLTQFRDLRLDWLRRFHPLFASWTRSLGRPLSPFLVPLWSRSLRQRVPADLLPRPPERPRFPKFLLPRSPPPVPASRSLAAGDSLDA